MGVVNDILALRRVVRNASLKRQCLGQEMTKRWVSHQKVLSCKRWEPQIQGFWCGDESGVSISTKTNEMKWGIVGEVSLEREVKVRSWRPRQVSGLYSKSDTTSLEFYEKESDTIQLIYHSGCCVETWLWGKVGGTETSYGIAHVQLRNHGGHRGSEES